MNHIDDDDEDGAQPLFSSSGGRDDGALHVCGRRMSRTNVVFVVALSACVALIVVLGVLLSLQDRTGCAAAARPSFTASGPQYPSATGIGAINAIARDAGGAYWYVGATNGGVWRTSRLQNPSQPAEDDDDRNDPDADWGRPPMKMAASDQDSSQPPAARTQWTQLTDGNGCQSVSSIASGPGLLVYTCGRVSSFAFYAGPLDGVYRSTDGGSTWQVAGNVSSGWDFARAVIVGGDGAVVAVAKARRVAQANSGFVYTFDSNDGGVFLSDDGAATFRRSDDPLVAGTPLMDVAASSAGVLFTSSRHGGVYASHDGGRSWSDVGQHIDTSSLRQVTNSRVAVADAAQRLYVAMCDNATHGLVAWTTVGSYAPGDWRTVPLPPDVCLYGGVYFLALTPDLLDDRLFYVAGALFSVYQGNVTADADVFVSLTLQSWPHADNRFLVHDPAANALLLGCDGGVYQLDRPQTVNASIWGCYNGNLQTTEFMTVAYDARSKTYAGGAQDNGVYMSTSPALAQQLGSEVPYYNFESGDGEGVVFNSAASPAVLYGTSQHLYYMFSYQLGAAAEQEIHLPDWLAGAADFETDLQMNAADPALIMVCSNPGCTCWQLDFGDDPLTLDPVVTTVLDLGNTTTSFSNYFYGGRKDGLVYRDVVFGLAYNDFVYARDRDGSVTVASPNRQWYLPSRSRKYRLAVNPDDYYEMVTCIVESQVWRTTDFGASWQLISGDLFVQTNNTDPLGWGVAIVPLLHADRPLSAVVLGTAMGLWASFSDHIGRWHPLRSDQRPFPNVRVSNLLYNRDDDILIAATLGRGWWTLHQASQVLQQTYKHARCEQ